MTFPFAGRIFEAVLFDNDGTLIDSLDAVRRSWVAWAIEHQVDPFDLQKFHGLPAAAIVATLLPDGDTSAALARIMEIEEADTEGVVALPGAREAFRALGPRAAIATSATRDLAIARLEAAGIEIPTVLVTADDITRGKPDPEPYLLAALRLGADPSQCLVVEDAPSGLTSARAAGCATLAVVSTHEAHELEADLVVPDLSHVTFEIGAAGIRVHRDQTTASSSYATVGYASETYGPETYDDVGLHPELP